MVAAVKGYKLILVMPDSMSIERRRLMLSYGATFRLTPRANGMKGAIARAQEFWPPRRAHGFHSNSRIQPTSRCTCAPPRRKSQGFSGRGGRAHHRCGHRRPPDRLRTGTQENLALKLKVFAVEPSASPVISGSAPPRRIRSGHRRGLRAGQPARAARRRHQGGSRGRQGYAAPRARREEGILVGISSGATLAAIAKAARTAAGSQVIGFNYDTGERYISVGASCQRNEARSGVASAAPSTVAAHRHLDVAVLRQQHVGFDGVAFGAVLEVFVTSGRNSSSLGHQAVDHLVRGAALDEFGHRFEVRPFLRIAFDDGLRLGRADGGLGRTAGGDAHEHGVHRSVSVLPCVTRRHSSVTRAS